MAAEVEPPTLPPSTDGEHPFAKEDMERMLEFDRIVKFRDSITSGQHPRIKIPPHLLPAASTSTTRSSSNAAGPVTAAEQHPDLDSPKIKHRAESGRAQAAGMTTLPGLGLVPSGPAAMTGLAQGEAKKDALSVGGQEKEEVRADPALLARPGSLSKAEAEQERAKLEKALKAQVTQKAQANKTQQAREALPDFVVDEVLQKARLMEEGFSPPPQVAVANDATNTTSASTIAVASVAPADESVDDATFYSSNFSTPEFGLKARISIEPEADDVSMEEGSDYEPELDIIPSPIVHEQAPADDSYDPAQPFVPLVVAHPLTEHQGFYGAAPKSEPAMQGTQANPSGVPAKVGGSQWQGNWPGPLSGAVQLGKERAPTNYGESSFQVAADDTSARPPSPFVRVHRLSPVGPQPLALAPQITPVLQEQVEALAAQAAQVAEVAEASRRTPAQVALLRREEISQSSPDSSPQAVAGARQVDKNKPKKKNNKRKATQPDFSPRVKAEPRSPSPIVAPPTRPSKRPRQAARTREEEQDARNGSGYGSAAHDGYAAPRGVQYAEHPPPVVREERVPVVYERVEPVRYAHGGSVASHPLDLQQHDPYSRRDWEVYETRPSTSGPQGTIPTSPLQRAGSGLTRYALPPSRTELRPVRAASHALAEASSGYPSASRNGYTAASANAGAYEAGRMSVRPETVLDPQSRSPYAGPPRTPAMGPPSGPPSARPQYHYPENPPPAQQPVARIVVDEFGREYYEPPPSQPPIRQRVRYEPQDVRQEWSQSAPTYTAAQLPRAGSQMPPTFEQEGVIYRRASPAYAHPRRVVTQPEYGAQAPAPTASDYGRYQQKEYMARPPQAGEEYVQVRQAPPSQAPLPREYMVRASTAVPPDAIRYETSGRYIDRVGSVQPPDVVPAGHEYAAPGNSVMYGNRIREMPAPNGYVVGGRAYSVRPEPQQPVGPRAYSVQPASPGSHQGPSGPPRPPYYVERLPAAPGSEYGYPDDGRQTMYR